MLSLLIGLVSLAPAAPTASAHGLPIEVERYVAEQARFCRKVGGVPGDNPKLVTSVDLNGDDVPDYIVDLGHYDCEGAVSAIGGQLGQPVTIFIGTKDHSAYEAFRGLSLGVTVEASGGSSRVYLVVQGAACGQALTADTPISDWKSCSRQLDWNAATRSFSLAPLEQVRRVPRIIPW